MSVDLEQVHDKVNDVLSQIRPYLLEDGGDVELIGVSESLVAKIELKGTCTSCSMNGMTFKNSIEDSIKRMVPEITQVEAVNFKLKQPSL